MAIDNDVKITIEPDGEEDYNLNVTIDGECCVDSIVVGHEHLCEMVAEYTAIFEALSVPFDVIDNDGVISPIG